MSFLGLLCKRPGVPNQGIGTAMLHQKVLGNDLSWGFLSSWWLKVVPGLEMCRLNSPPSHGIPQARIFSHSLLACLYPNFHIF